MPFPSAGNQQDSYRIAQTLNLLYQGNLNYSYAFPTIG